MVAVEGVIFYGENLPDIVLYVTICSIIVVLTVSKFTGSV